MDRVVEPEMLDHLPAQDPRAVRSRRDLRRLNAWMGHASHLTRALRPASGAPAPRRVVELGAGDGTLMLAVARRLGSACGGASVVLVDRREALSPETQRTFSDTGWQAQIVVADVFEWLDQAGAESCDAMIANLFLHHFAGPRLAELLRAAARTTPVFIALEPRRSAATLLFSRVLWLAGCGPVTRHDAPISVRAGFAGTELSRAWPADRNWNLREHPVGWFSHLFVARRPTHTC